VLEVGCGDGLIINKVTAPDTMAVDISVEGLKTVNGPSLQCSVTELPFGDGRYELVIASELLEHLPDEEYRQALSEIARVARRFILVTVPNKENLTVNLTRCPSCGKQYHRAWHIRSFRPEDMERLFEGFAVVECKAIGPVEQTRTRLEAWLRRTLDWGPPPPWPTTCPYCGTAQAKPGDQADRTDVGVGGISDSRPARSAMRYFRGRKRPWLAGLFKKKSSRGGE